jgi:Cupredoxin-like domain
LSPKAITTSVRCGLLVLLLASCGGGETEPGSAAGNRSPTVAPEASVSPLVAPDGCDPKGSALSLSTEGAGWVGPDGKRIAPGKLCLAVPANAPFTIELNNTTKKGDGFLVTHNVSIVPETAAAIEQPLFTGKTIEPGKSITYEIPALEPAVYKFRCDVHRELMWGLLNVE